MSQARRNDEKFLNKLSDINRDVFNEKTRAYIAEKQKTNNNDNYDDSEDQKNDEEYSENENNDNYYVSEEMRYMNYYESYNVSENDDNAIYLIISEMFFSFKCKQCVTIFSFNNKLHQHIEKCFIIKKIDIMLIKTRKLFNEVIILQNVLQNTFTIIDETSFNDLKSFAEIYVISIIKIIKTFSLCFIVKFTVNSIKNIDTNYDFRDWEYARVKIALSSHMKFDFECLNIDFDIILMNKNFFKTQVSDVIIKKMITFIFVRELNINKHMFDEYVIIDMYFSEKNKNKNAVMIKIIREAHLINDLKVNMLIDNDCIEFEKIVVNLADDTAHIDNCDVIVVVNVKTSRIIMQISIHARKIVIVFSQSEIAISVHYTIIFSDRNFLFELEELNLTLYAHLVNAETRSIIVRNDEDKTVHLSRNCRVDRMTEVDFSNVFLMKSEMHNLVMKSLKTFSEYKSS